MWVTLAEAVLVPELVEDAVGEMLALALALRVMDCDGAGGDGDAVAEGLIDSLGVRLDDGVWLGVGASVGETLAVFSVPGSAGPGLGDHGGPSAAAGRATGARVSYM